MTIILFPCRGICRDVLFLCGSVVVIRTVISALHEEFTDSAAAGAATPAR
jgi:hypothetical protein